MMWHKKCGIFQPTKMCHHSLKLVLITNMKWTDVQNNFSINAVPAVSTLILQWAAWHWVTLQWLSTETMRKWLQRIDYTSSETAKWGQMSNLRELNYGISKSGSRCIKNSCPCYCWGLYVLLCVQRTESSSATLVRHKKRPPRSDKNKPKKTPTS